LFICCTTMRNRCSLQDLVTRSRGRTLYLPILNRYVLFGYPSIGFTSKPDLGRIGFFSNSSSNVRNFSTTCFGTSHIFEIRPSVFCRSFRTTKKEDKIDVATRCSRTGITIIFGLEISFKIK
jgi:hypothetical protein